MKVERGRERERRRLTWVEIIQHFLGSQTHRHRVVRPGSFIISINDAVKQQETGDRTDGLIFQLTCCRAGPAYGDQCGAMVGWMVKIVTD